MKTTNLWTWTRWAPLLALTATLAACGAAVTPEPAAAPAQTPTPATEPFGSCDDSAIRLLDRGDGIHGAIVADTLHLGGATAPATCTDPTNESLAARLADAGGRTEQAQQSEYYLIVIRYTSGNRLYVISLRGDGTACVVDTDDECVAEVTGLPEDFDLGDLPDDVARTIPAGRPAPPTVSPPGGDDTPAGSDDPPPAANPPPAPSGPPGAASNPQPRDGATGVTVNMPILRWAAAPGAISYEVHWSEFRDRITSEFTAPVVTSSTFVRMSARQSTEVGDEWGRLKGETTYYWRVEAKSVAGTALCPPPFCTRSRMWSFTTGPASAAGEAPPAPPAAETPPAGSKQAPAWPAAARDYEIEGTVNGYVFGRKLHFAVPPPTGNPKPVISVDGLAPWALRYDPRAAYVPLGAYHIWTERKFGAKGTIALVASNSEGSAKLEVPYNLTCRYTLAETIEQLRGSWVPWRATTPGKYTALTIGDTITTVPASVGTLDQDWVSERARTGRSRSNLMFFDHSGHTVCNAIYHPDWNLARGHANSWYSPEPWKPVQERVGCEIILSIRPRGEKGHLDTTAFVLEGCQSPDGTRIED